ncbi:hypothetical protein [Nostoc sp.]|uniref:hypothetical protein n=1 Tax=Nostoc sp. TaxID=1180 RepID=UPI002FF7FA05
MKNSTHSRELSFWAWSIGHGAWGRITNVLFGQCPKDWGGYPSPTQEWVERDNRFR